MRLFLLACAWALVSTALAAERLPALNVDIRETSVSGLSSGAHMAVQFHLAHASIVRGVGILAGGPWGCAAGSAQRATGECMQGSPDVEPLLRAAREAAERGAIDPLAGVARARVWLFSGYNDGVVRRSVMDRLHDFYRALAPREQVFYRYDLPAGHALVTADAGAACNTTGGAFVVDCDYAAAGALLQFIYGRLQAPHGASRGRLLAFDQSEFVAGGLRSASLAQTGHVYVPEACASGAPCRVHVALHGCRQATEAVGDAFVRGAGYNAWADANRLVVLYPQARATWGMPWNPYGCWDWWGYTGPGYATRAGVQVRAIHAMLERIASGRQDDVPAGGSTGSGAMLDPAVVDAAPDALALAWRPVPGVGRYEVHRDDGGQVWRIDGTRASLADSGLPPDTAFSYTVRAIGPAGAVASERVAGRTARRPPPCDPWFASNPAHVAAGRAYVVWGRTYAAGTGDSMGWWNVLATTPLYRVPSGWAVGTCP
jgi:poly(3-hydroxybutyrate) depolymerase